MESEGKLWPPYSRESQLYATLNSDDTTISYGPRATHCAFWNEMINKYERLGISVILHNYYCDIALLMHFINSYINRSFRSADDNCLLQSTFSGEIRGIRELSASNTQVDVFLGVSLKF